MQGDPLALAIDYGPFLGLGVIGAVFANATGAGGGVVFVPFFTHLGFAGNTIVATSFAIQCCGMTAGAFTWWRYYKGVAQVNNQWQPLISGLYLCIPGSLLGIVIVQYTTRFIAELTWLSVDMNYLHWVFGIFSVLLAIAILCTAVLSKRQVFHVNLGLWDKAVLVAVAIVGGMITAWLSVGVGELIAVYLIIRGFNVTMAIALAVIVSACSVWGAVVFHVFVSQAIFWPVVLFAGAGAIIGGVLAKYVVLFFPPRKLKVFFGLWVLVLGIASLPLF